jgi:hypothetical protein
MCVGIAKCPELFGAIASQIAGVIGPRSPLARRVSSGSNFARLAFNHYGTPFSNPVERLHHRSAGFVASRCNAALR